jgi:hypothetical protein
MKTLSNGWKIPTDRDKALEMLRDFEKNLNRTYDLSAAQKGRSQIFDYDKNSKIDRENQPPIKIGEVQK